jgi:hypothetical protein
MHRVLRELLLRVERNEGALCPAPGLFRQPAFTDQLSQCIKRCCVLLQVLAAQVVERKLGEALRRISLNGRLHIFVLVLSHVIRV